MHLENFLDFSLHSESTRSTRVAFSQGPVCFLAGVLNGRKQLLASMSRRFLSPHTAQKRIQIGFHSGGLLSSILHETLQHFRCTSFMLSSYRLRLWKMVKVWFWRMESCQSYCLCRTHRWIGSSSFSSHLIKILWFHAKFYSNIPSIFSLMFFIHTLRLL